MAENYKMLYEQMKKMLEMYQDEIVPKLREELEKRRPIIDTSDDDFGAVLNCAVRYALGRKTYMPHLVMDFIRPLIPHLSDKTLWCFAIDIEEAKREDRLGDPYIDAPAWYDFLGAVQEERNRRVRNG